jgi:hypothetical protein
MSELSPDEFSIAAAGADLGRTAAAHEPRGIQTFAVTSAPAPTPIGQTDTRASPVSTTGRIDYLLAELRRASLQARLLQADIDAVGQALKGGLITAEQALWHLEDIGIQRLFIEGRIMKPNEENFDNFGNRTNGITKTASPHPTPQTTIEAILYCVRERGPTALRAPANIERLSRCDRAARAEIDQRMAAMERTA